MNLYSTLNDVKSRLGISATTDDALLMAYLEAASREIDAICHRHFYCETATRYFDTGSSASRRSIDDALSITTFTTDSELDGTFDGETWTEGATSDFVLWPWNSWPKMEVVVAKDGDHVFQTHTEQYIKIVGLWGYGDGKSATPYEAAGVTVTVADGATTLVAVSADSIIKPGHTILAGTEQMYVSAVAAGSFTAERGVNGTTGAAQAAAAASIYRYPKLITQAVEIATADIYGAMGSEGLSSERIGDYSYQKLTNRGDAMITTVLGRFVGPYMKAVIA